MTKITCIAMVRNEGDIIEAFCSHLSALFDAIVLIDHASVDGTREYMEALSQRDRRFHLYDFVEPAYEQSALVTFAAHHLPPVSGSDWVFLLDADEFLPFPDRAAFRSALDGLRQDPVIALTDRALLLRLDNGYDAMENNPVITAHNEQHGEGASGHYITKWNHSPPTPGEPRAVARLRRSARRLG